MPTPHAADYPPPHPLGRYSLETVLPIIGDEVNAMLGALLLTSPGRATAGELRQDILNMASGLNPSLVPTVSQIEVRFIKKAPGLAEITPPEERQRLLGHCGVILGFAAQEDLSVRHFLGMPWSRHPHTHYPPVVRYRILSLLAGSGEEGRSHAELLPPAAQKDETETGLATLGALVAEGHILPVGTPQEEVSNSKLYLDPNHAYVPTSPERRIPSEIPESFYRAVDTLHRQGYADVTYGQIYKRMLDMNPAAHYPQEAIRLLWNTAQSDARRGTPGLISQARLRRVTLSFASELKVQYLVGAFEESLASPNEFAEMARAALADRVAVRSCLLAYKNALEGGMPEAEQQARSYLTGRIMAEIQRRGEARVADIEEHLADRGLVIRREYILEQLARLVEDRQLQISDESREYMGGNRKTRVILYRPAS
jgi:hypothetical protein